MPNEQSINLLIVEDDPSVGDMLELFFTSQGMTTAIARDGKQAIPLVASFNPDIIVLDIVLPFMDGFSVLDKLRSEGKTVPVILLTEKSSVEERISGFEHGADDYVTKPFSPKELLMRVQAVLRRANNSNEPDKLQTITINELSLNPVTREAGLLGIPSPTLTKTEFDLLYFLAQKKNEVVTHKTLLKEILQYNPTSQTKVLVVHIANIRKKIDLKGKGGVRLLTVSGVGYKLLEHDDNLT
ncbi:MAG TPA: response regulator transcription factor [Desulfobacterales bacterium]|nr:response regulator transcription factor [Desulfobacterales bacterium]